MTLRRALRLFLEAAALGGRALRRGTLRGQGLRHTVGALVMPINSPPRYPEYDVFFSLLGDALGDRPASVLDVGSPKTFSLLLAQRLPVAITAVDLWPPAVERARALHGGLATGSPGSVVLDVADASEPLGEERFDAAYAMSVLEHVEPDPGGDEVALRNIAAAVRPGGPLVVSLPLDVTARSDFGRTPSYGSQSLFFQRVYDAAAIERLLRSAEDLLVLESARSIRWPERGPFRALWDVRQPEHRILFAAAFPLLALQFEELDGVASTRGDVVLLLRRV